MVKIEIIFFMAGKDDVPAQTHCILNAKPRTSSIAPMYLWFTSDSFERTDKPIRSTSTF